MPITKTFLYNGLLFRADTIEFSVSIGFCNDSDTLSAIMQKDSAILDALKDVFSMKPVLQSMLDFMEYPVWKSLEAPSNVKYTKDAFLTFQNNLDREEFNIYEMLSCPLSSAFCSEGPEGWRKDPFVESLNYGLKWISEQRGLSASELHNSRLLERKLRMEKQNDEDEGYVYLVSSEHGFKIGKTRKPSQRQNVFEVKLPFLILFVHCQKYKGYSQVERALHRHFNKKHLNGEWFDLNEKDVEFVKNYRPELMIAEN